jgi:hypothetical protein
MRQQLSIRGTKAPGWLIAVRHGQTLTPDWVGAPMYTGKYLRLTFDGGVVTRDFYWRWIDDLGTPRYAVSASGAFEDDEHRPY